MFGLENNNATVAESYITQGKPIVKLSAFVGKETRLFGYLITKAGQFGPGVLLCGENEMISLPNRYLSNFRDSSDEDREGLKTGTKKLTDVRELTTKNGQKTVVFDIRDI